MALSVTHSTVVATADDGTSDVGSDEWNAAHTVAISGNLSPDASDGASLGTTTGPKYWSDLFLASGAVVNFNGGDVTLTHSANALNFAGGTLVFSATTGEKVSFFSGGDYSIGIEAAEMRFSATATGFYTFYNGSHSGGTEAFRLTSETSTMTVGKAGSSTGKLQLTGATSGTITIQGAAAAGTYTLTLPTDDGTANQFLQTNGSGVLTWATPTGAAMPHLYFYPQDNDPPTSNYATLDVRNSHPVLDFDDTTGEAAIFTGVLPTSYAGGGITVSVAYSATSATTGNAGWLVAIERIGDSQLDIDADSFAADQTITATAVPGTSGHVDVLSVSITNGANMDSLAAGEMFRVRITRDVANDTVTGDLELHWVKIVET